MTERTRSINDGSPYAESLSFALRSPMQPALGAADTHKLELLVRPIMASPWDRGQPPARLAKALKE